MPRVGETSSRYRLWNDDNLTVLRSLPENSIDAIVTDPPYGLGKEPEALDMLRDWLTTGHHDVKSGGGFMGKKWDNFVPQPAQWKECLRVLKPGGYLLTFAGTRTQDLVTLGLRIAGFEIRDTIAWVYGCLSEDTEVLIDGRWEHYHKAVEGSHALCYNKEEDTYSWQPIEERVIYDYDEIAYHIKSDETDQIVSRNHRCILDRGNGWEFMFAEEAARESEIHIPILKDVQSLLQDVPSFRPLSGGKKQNMFPKVCGQGGIKIQKGQANPIKSPKRKKDHLRCLQEDRMEVSLLSPQSVNPDLFKTVQRSVTRKRVGKACEQRTSRMVFRKRSGLDYTNDGRKQPGLEGGSHLLPISRKLQGNQVCPLSRRLSEYVSQGRIYNGTSVDSSPSDGTLSPANGGSTSRRPRSDEQRSNQSSSLRVEPRSQAIRSEGYTSSNLARITPIYYRGKVWCIRVPTGAFVARRNGKVFVTGNSGFPKSLDVSKAIDKAAGAEREVIGTGASGRAETHKTHAMGLQAEKGTNTFGGEYSITAPATDAAKQWAGWGTALKPAFEPITVARKPLIGTVAENVQRYGTGAINVDGCRVETGDKLGGGANKGMKPENRHEGFARPWMVNEVTRHEAAARSRANTAKAESLGRFPANLIHDGSEEVVGLFPDTGKSAGGKGGASALIDGGIYGKYSGEKKGANAGGLGDSGSAARFFYCAKASKRDRDEGLETFKEVATAAMQGNLVSGQPLAGNGTPIATPKRSNTHPTVKPTSLMQYLCRLVTPPGGLILDPFMGSGSTGKAAMYEGFRFTGIEMEAEYVKIAKARIDHAYRNRKK